MERPRVTVYTAGWCGYCQQARGLLERHGVPFDVVDVEDSAELREQMVARSGRRSVPQVFVGNHHVGGFHELAAVVRSGELDRLLAGADDAAATSQERN